MVFLYVYPILCVCCVYVAQNEFCVFKLNTNDSKNDRHGRAFSSTFLRKKCSNHAKIRGNSLNLTHLYFYNLQCEGGKRWQRTNFMERMKDTMVEKYSVDSKIGEISSFRYFKRCFVQIHKILENMR